MDPFNDDFYAYKQQNYLPSYQMNKKKIDREKLQRTLLITIKTITTINQIMPIIYQLKPLVQNTKNGIMILKAMRQFDDIDLDDIDNDIHPINQEKDKDIFENML